MTMVTNKMVTTFEHNNIYNSLSLMENIESIDYLPIDEIIFQKGKNFLNEKKVCRAQLIISMIYFFLSFLKMKYTKVP